MVVVHCFELDTNQPVKVEKRNVEGSSNIDALWSKIKERDGVEMDTGW